MATTATNTKVVSPAEWVKARKDLLAKEKEFTRLRDELSRKRREMPWEKVEKNYVFDGPRGKETLSDLFDGRSQLVVYHFMLGPGWKEGCPSCSYLADNFDGARVHMEQRDASFVVISRAPLAEIEAFKKRMGWKFKWVSSYGSDFNADYQVSGKQPDGKVYYNYGVSEFPAEERPGLSVFYKPAGEDIFHTYSTYSRGLDILLTTYNFLDMTPKGRDEEALAHPMAWVRHHDRYGTAKEEACCSGTAMEASRSLEPMLKEFREEAETTRRILGRVPADKLGWKPHAKSMSLGQLAMHIASVPGALARLTQLDGFDVTQGNFTPPNPQSVQEIQSAFEQSVRDAESCLTGMSDQSAQGAWRLSRGEKELFTRPRIEVMRSIMLNHWYHHRGQLSVYLRLLDVPVPVVYGPSADENPFQ
jgi:predicted dithiol-disulfide oxidoreductase (DUF899 family)/uncharacterized damage-inducible protein DinB